MRSGVQTNMADLRSTDEVLFNLKDRSVRRTSTQDAIAGMRVRRVSAPTIELGNLENGGFIGPSDKTVPNQG